MKRLGPYQLVERLGIGGMAEVFLAEIQRQGDFFQPCVVKILHKELAADKSFVRLLLAEARLISLLRHSNIASLYDVGRHEGNVFLVMEYVNGGDLHAVLANSVRAERQLSIGFAMHVAKNLCAGLHFAHTRRGDEGQPLHLVHRDISPQNVLVSLLGEVKLIDFGVAKFNSRLRERTRAGVIKGKFGYMSPEQAWDEELDQRSDLFSAGICLYEMLTGRSVYGQSNDPLIMLKRAREAAIEPITRWRPDLPQELVDIVHRALERNRENRFQNAHEFERALTLAMARHAPDYTSLDAGVLVSELLGGADPALDEISARHFSGGASQGFITEPAVDESTSPMATVPSPVGESGAYRQMQSDRSESATPDEETAVRTFSADEFPDEKTEVFDELRASGGYGVIERDGGRHQNGAGKPRPDRPRGRDAAWSTRRIEDDHAEEAETVVRRPLSAATLSGRHRSIASPSGPRNRGVEVDEVEVQERAPVLQTSRVAAIAPNGRRDDRRAHPDAPNDQRPLQSPADLLQDRRVQIGAALGFVILAIIFLVGRLF